MPQLPKPPKPTKPDKPTIDDVYQLVSVIFDLVNVVDNNVQDILERQLGGLAGIKTIVDQQMTALANHRIILDAIGVEQKAQTTDMKTLAAKTPNVSVIVEDRPPIVLHNQTKKRT